MSARITIVLVLAALLAVAAPAAAWEHHGYTDRHDNHLDRASLELDDDGILVVEHHRYDDVLEFSPDGTIVLNGDRLELDADATKLAKRYHRLGVKICERAEIIGEKGAALGGYGALVAVKALSKVFAEFGVDDDDDLDRLDRIDIDTVDFDRLGDEIEEEAEVIEEWADEMDEIADDLSERSRDLRRLRWFRS